MTGEPKYWPMVRGGNESTGRFRFGGYRADLLDRVRSIRSVQYLFARARLRRDGSDEPVLCVASKMKQTYDAEARARRRTAPTSSACSRTGPREPRRGGRLGALENSLRRPSDRHRPRPARGGRPRAGAHLGRGAGAGARRARPCPVRAHGLREGHRAPERPRCYTSGRRPMEVIQRVRVACPRCGAAVAGDFKFCPTCAYRLKTGTTPVEPDGGPRPRSMATLLLAVSGALLLGLIAGIGVWIFRDREPVRPPSTSHDLHGRRSPWKCSRSRRCPATCAACPPGPPTSSARWTRRAATSDPWIPMQVDALDTLIYEVPRSFFRSSSSICGGGRTNRRSPRSRRSGTRRPRPSSPRAPVPEPLAVGLHEPPFRRGRPVPAAPRPPARPVARGGAQEVRRPGERPEPQAHRRLRRVMPFPWPRKLGLLLIAPPSWVSVNTWDEFVVEMPHGTGSLPVTDVSWTDACACAEWATRRTGGAVRYRLPVAGEWIRIAHGNHPPGGPSDETAWDFPWGKSLLRYACNNAELYGGTRDPILQPVGLTYRDVDASGVHDGTTVDGIFDMAGNVREWVLNESARPQPVERRLPRPLRRRGGPPHGDRIHLRRQLPEGPHGLPRPDERRSTQKAERKVDIGFRTRRRTLPLTPRGRPRARPTARGTPSNARARWARTSGARRRDAGPGAREHRALQLLVPHDLDALGHVRTVLRPADVGLGAEAVLLLGHGGGARSPEGSYAPVGGRTRGPEPPPP